MVVFDPQVAELVINFDLARDIDTLRREGSHEGHHLADELQFDDDGRCHLCQTLQGGDRTHRCWSQFICPWCSFNLADVQADRRTCTNPQCEFWVLISEIEHYYARQKCGRHGPTFFCDECSPPLFREFDVLSGKKFFDITTDDLSTIKRFELKAALQESVKLQSHYAEQLNMHDGGERRGFATAREWVERLKETGTIKT